MHHADERPTPTRSRWGTIAVVAVVVLMLVAAGVTLWVRSRPPKPVFQSVCGSQVQVGMVHVVAAVIRVPTVGQGDSDVTELACVM
jgi:hypothetical protein